MRNRFLALSFVLLVGCGTAHQVKRLSSPEQDHYYALKVWMSDDERKGFLKGKTEADRDAWLKERGFWDRFYQYDEATRKKIVAGEVEVGFRQEQVFMAWGEPHKRTRLPGRPATRSEMFVYRFEVDEDGNVLVWTPDSKTTYKAAETYEMDLYVDDQVVTEMERKDGWPE